MWIGPFGLMFRKNESGNGCLRSGAVLVIVVTCNAFRSAFPFLEVAMGMEGKDMVRRKKKMKKRAPRCKDIVECKKVDRLGVVNDVLNRI